MRCEEFSARINLLLDERCNPLTDQAIVLHAAECERCEHVLHCWQEIDEHLLCSLVSSAKTAPRWADSPADSASHRTDLIRLDPATKSGSRHSQRVATWMTIAAAACWLVFTVDHSPQISDPTPPLYGTNSPMATAEIANFNMHEIDLQNLDFRIDEPTWWGELATATLKPVEPLKNSFRPLTKSFQSALQILTPQQEATPSEPIVPDCDFSAQRHQMLYNAV